MEGTLTWLFGTVHRVPSGRSSSFTQPLFPPILPPASLPPKGVLACPLPKVRNHPRPRPATVGHDVDTWAQHTAHYVTNSRGQRLFVQVWRPHPSVPNSSSTSTITSKNKINSILLSPFRFLKHVASNKRRRSDKEKAIIYIIHGLNDHSNKYTRVAKSWVNAGFIVVAYDAHGHGRSDGFRAYTSSMAHYVQDAQDAIKDTDRRLFPNRICKLPKFLLAHSLGGAVAIHLARDAPRGAFHGVMLTAPAVRVFPKPLLKLFAPILGTFAPLLPVQRLKFDKNKKKRREQQQQRKYHRSDEGSMERIEKILNMDQYDDENMIDDGDGDYCPYDDPLVVRSPVRARVGYEVLKSCEKIMSEADKFKLPLFVAHSSHDTVTNAKGTLEFHSRIASGDKTVKIYDGRVHDLLSEKREIVMVDMVDWASKRL